MSLNIFYRLHPVMICLVLVVLLLLAQGVGRIAARRTQRPDGMEKQDIALILGAVMTLLVFMLGFTYAMSENRFEMRRQLVIEEANAIGTTYLRAQTLPEPRSTEMQALLRQYVALRVEDAESVAARPEKLGEADKRAKALLGSMWSHATTLAKEYPNPIVSIFLQTLNAMIDIHAQRLAAFRNRVPVTIYLVLFLISATALWMVGYYFGRYQQRARFLSVMLALLFPTVMWLILDLDQPVSGAIRASQQSLIELHMDLNQAQVHPAQRTP
jgi:hypothetical protein